MQGISKFISKFYSYSITTRCATDTFSVGTPLSRTLLMFQKNLMTHWITKPLHFNTSKRLTVCCSICMTNLLNPIKQWRNAIVNTRLVLNSPNIYLRQKEQKSAEGAKRTEREIRESKSALC